MEKRRELTLKSLNAELIDAIVARTSLSADEIEKLDIEKIEDKLGIKAHAHKTYFAWEEEKRGLQLSPYKFVPKEMLDKRECKMDALLKNK